EVAGDAALRAEQLEGYRGSPGIHGVVAAYREDRDVRLVEPANELHVTEDAGVAGEVELRPVLDLDDDAARLPHVVPVGVRARMVCIREGELDPGSLDGAPLVRIEDVLDTLLALQPPGELDRSDHRAAVLLRQSDGVAEMVAVAVGERDHVDSLGL